MTPYRFFKVSLWMAIAILGPIQILAYTDPVARPDARTTGVNTTILVDVLANDDDLDGDALTVKLGASGDQDNLSLACGTLYNNRDGSLTFVPTDGYRGTCNFTYRITDGNSADNATLTLTVDPNKTTDAVVVVDHPADAIAAPGGTATFTVTAAGQNLSFQWQFEGVDLVLSQDFSVDNDTNTSELTVSDMAADRIGDYRCVVSGEDLDTGTILSAVSESGHLRLDSLSGSGAFAGTLPSLPASFEAESYDLGTEGTSHHDLSADNSGLKYRTGTADIARDDTGRYHLTDLENGEWLDYSFQNDRTTALDFILTAAADPATAPDGIRFALKLDGATYMCQREFGVTQGANDWQDFTLSGIVLPVGAHVLRIEILSDGWFLDGFELVDSDMVQTPYTANGLPHETGLIQIEAYDSGGPDVAYQNAGAGNSGSFCGREPDWVDLFTNGSRVHLADITANDWLEYTVDLANGEGNYNLDIRYTTTGTGSGQLLVSIPAEGNTFPVTLPATPFGTWETHKTFDLALGSGIKTLRLAFTDPNYGLDYFTLESSVPQVAIAVTDQDANVVANGSVYPFGTTRATMALQKSFTISNPHQTAALQIANFQMSGPGWTAIQQPPASVPPGGNGSFSVQLFSTTALGDTSGQVSFDTAGANRDGFSFGLTGTVSQNLTNMVVEYDPLRDGTIWEPINNNRNFTLIGEEDQYAFRVVNQYDPQDGVPLNVTITRDNDSFVFFHNNQFKDVDSLSFTVNPIAQFPFENFAVIYDNDTPDQPLQEVNIEITGNAPEAPFQFSVRKWVFDGGPLQIETPLPTLSGVVGGTAQGRFLVSGGTEDYVYKWQIDDGGFCCTYVDIDPSLPNHDGENTAELTISNLSLDQDGDIYKVTAWDAVSYDPGNPDLGNFRFVDHIRLYVYDVVSVSSQPQSQHAGLGETVTYSVGAAGGSGQFDYQWQYRTQGGAWTNITVDGSHYTTNFYGDDLNVVGVTDADVGEYRCRISQKEIPTNLVFSAPAYLSTLRFTQHPSDTLSNGSSTFSVAAQAGGLPLTYEWVGVFDQDDWAEQLEGSVPDGEPLSYHDPYGDNFSGVDTATLVFHDWRTVLNLRSFACKVSDGYATRASFAGAIHLITTGLASGDYFWHGPAQPQNLDGLALPFGNQSWNADSGLRHYAGKAFLPSSAQTQATATIPWIPPIQITNRIEIEPEFPAGANANYQIDFGFFSQSQPNLWARLSGNGTFQIYTGASTLLHSGSAGGSLNASTMMLAMDDQNRTVSFFKGSQTLAAGIPLPQGYEPDFVRAGFRINRPGGGSDLGIRSFLTRSLDHVSIQDDVVYLDRALASSILIAPLENDFGASLSIDQGIPINPPHGSATISQGTYLEYTPDANWVGWDDFAYAAWHSTTLEGGYARIRVFTHNGPTLYAGEDTFSILPDQATTLDIFANDFSTVGHSFDFNSSNPISVQPTHGQVVINPDNTVTYTPDAGYLGFDRFKYRSISEGGLGALAWVNLYVGRSFKGGFGDDFLEEGPARGKNLKLERTATTAGNGIWREEPGSGTFVFSNGQLRTTAVANTFTSKPYLELPYGIDAIDGPHVQDDFESGSAGDWDDIRNDTYIDFNHTPAITGSKSMAVTLPGGSANSTPTLILTNFLPEKTRRVKTSFKFRVDQYNGDPNSRTTICRAGSPDGGGLLVQYIHTPTPSFRFLAYLNNGQASWDGWHAVNPVNGVFDIDVEWWAGANLTPVGGAIFTINGQTISKLDNLNNLNQLLQWLWFGTANSPTTLSAEFVFDDISVQTPSDVTLTQSIKYNAQAGSEFTFLGWFSEADKYFADYGQTALFLRAHPGGYNIFQTNAMPGMRGRVIQSGSYAHTPGVPSVFALQYHPFDRTVSLTIDGIIKADQVPLTGELDSAILDKAGFYFRGSDVAGLRLDDFGVYASQWPAIATDDHYTLFQNEILTVDLRDNDLNPNGYLPQILEQPTNGSLDLNSDGTITYKPQLAGPDRFTYSLGVNGSTSRAVVHFLVDPALGPTSPEPIPLVRTFEDGFESRVIDPWVRYGNSSQFSFTSANPITDVVSAKFQINADPPSVTKLRHSEPEDRNYLRVRFKFNPGDVSLASGQSYQVVATLFGEVQALSTLLYRDKPQPQILIQGLAPQGQPWTGSQWQSLDPNLAYQTIDFEFWGSHPGYTGGGLRLWLNGDLRFERTNFEFREDIVRHLDIGWIFAPQQGSTGSMYFDDVTIYRSAYVQGFQDDFENGLVAWDEEVDPSGYGNLETTNPLEGTASYGVQQPVGTNKRAFHKNATSPTKHYRVQFKMATSNVSMNPGDNHIFFFARNPDAAVVRGFYEHRPTPRIMIQGFRPNGNWTGGGWRNVDPAIETTGVLVETEWWSDSILSDQGGIRHWFDGQLMYETTNANHADEAVTDYFWGVISAIDQDTQGKFLFDDFHWWTFEARE